jgi:CrcB protein
VTIPATTRLFLVTGFCGAFTTMSSFVYETDQLMRNGQSMHALVYFAATLLGSFALFFTGYFAMKIIFK